MRPICLLAVLLLFAAVSASAKTTHRCFIGYAYHLDSSKFAYTETHKQTLENGQLATVHVIYRDPAGHTIATKKMDFSHNRFVPVYRLTIPAKGYVEGIRHNKNGWQMYRRKNSGAAFKTKSFDIDSPIAGDSGFNPLVQKYFHKLASGKTVDFSFAVAGRLSVIGMKAEKVGDTTFEGKPALRFKAELNMFFINWFVSPIYLTYNPQNKRLEQYEGISNMHGSDGDPYPVRVSYYLKPPKDAPRAAAYCGKAGD